jgi:hypothetical protein
MNGFLTASGLVAAFMLVGHSTIGRKQFFLPMLGATFDPAAKRVMEFVWHMSTAALALPPAVLLYAAWYGVDGSAMRYLIAYLALQFALWGAVHLVLMSSSGLPGAVYKMFQWSLFLAVVGLTRAGLSLA